MLKKYFIDTEFIEYPNTIQLISIGMVCDDGREYYAVSSEYEFEKADEWVISNVILGIFNEIVPKENTESEHLSTFHKAYGKSIKTISEEVQAFVKEGGTRPEFWGYYYTKNLLTHNKLS